MCERFARTASNLRFAFSSPPKRDVQKHLRGFSSGSLKRFARIIRFARICESIPANRAIFESSGGSPSEGHNPPRGSPRKFASQRALRGLSEGAAGVSPRALRGSAGFCGGPRDFPRVFGGSDPMPKGPFGTKNAIALRIVVKYYRGSILLSVPICCHFSQKKKSIRITIAVVNYYRGSELLSR